MLTGLSSVLTGAACSPVDMFGGEPKYSHVYVISDTFPAVVDKMCYIAVFGTKNVFETTVPANTRAKLYNYITDLHKADGARQNFADAWKAYVRGNTPVEEKPRNQAMDEEMVSILGPGDSDEEPARLERLGGGEPATPPA